MAYQVDANLSAGLDLLQKGKKIDTACKLINKSARHGTTKGKSFFYIGEIMRTGIQANGQVGLEPHPEESKTFYDQALVHFLKGTPDSKDYLLMGDYFNYGYGTEPVNKNRALEYYEKAAASGDDVAPEANAKAEAIKKELASGSANVDQVLTPETQAPVVAETAPVAATVASVADVAPKAEEKPVENVPAAEEAPEVKKESTFFSSVEHIRSVVNGDAQLVRGIRLLDSPVSTDAERHDAVELIKEAEKNGSLRAAVLLGYLYEGSTSVLPKDLEESKKHYEVAIGYGSASAEYRLGLLYLNEEAPFFSQERGHELILSSARHGYAYALNYLGDAFRSKVANPKNLELAYRYYALAGERGLGLAYHNMAEIDASRQEFELSSAHEKSAFYNGYDPMIGTQDPLFVSLHL